MKIKNVLINVLIVEYAAQKGNANVQLDISEKHATLKCARIIAQIQSRKQIIQAEHY